MSPRRRLGLVGGVLAAILVAGCGGGTERAAASKQDADTSDTASSTRIHTGDPADGVDAQRLRELNGGTEYRYGILNETEALTNVDFTDLALVGQVVGYQAGPNFAPDIPGSSGDSVIMLVKPTDVFVGDTDENKNVQVVLLAPTASAADYSSALPQGSDVALYLQPVPDLPPEQSKGRYVPVTPQGFIVSDDGEGVLYPMDGTLDDPDATLDEQLPPAVDAG